MAVVYACLSAGSDARTTLPRPHEQRKNSVPLLCVGTGLPRLHMAARRVNFRGRRRAWGLSTGGTERPSAHGLSWHARAPR